MAKSLEYDEVLARYRAARENDLFVTKEVSVLIKMADNTIRRWVENEDFRLEPLHSGGKVYYKKSSIRAYAEGELLHLKLLLE